MTVSLVVYLTDVPSLVKQMIHCLLPPPPGCDLLLQEETLSDCPSDCRTGRVCRGQKKKRRQQTQHLSGLPQRFLHSTNQVFLSISLSLNVFHKPGGSQPTRRFGQKGRSGFLSPLLCVLFTGNVVSRLTQPSTL